MSMKSYLVLAAFALLAPSVASANTTPIVADVAADWSHELSGAKFPAELDGFSRSEIADYGKQQLDISGLYRHGASKTIATLYVYRAGLTDASIWHDRIQTIIGLGPLGDADHTKALRSPFPAPGGNGNGIRTVLPMSGKGILSSGIAVFEHDDWLVAIRMSSETLSVAELDGRLSDFVAAVPIPSPKRAADPAYAISPCAESIPESKAKRAKADMTDAIISGLFVNAAEDNEELQDKEARPEKPLHFCRDGASSTNYGVYRSGGIQDGYVVALGDAGVALSVYQDSLGALLNKQREGRYSVTLSTAEARLSYAPFRSLPAVAQVLEVLNKENPISSTTRPVGNSKDTNINIGVPSK